MQIDWLRYEGNERLAVIVMGWACNGGPVRHIQPAGYDILRIYDYRGLGSVLAGEDTSPVVRLTGILENYSRRTLIAWSFGVWVSERLFGAEGICPVHFDKSTALNGTPFPSDEQCGIGRRRLTVTLRGLRAGGMDEFNRKAYGKWYDGFPGEPTARSLDENIAELQELISLSGEPYTPSLHWDSALVGSEDAIFPPENMLGYWGTRAKTVPLPHYPFGESDIILELF